MRVITATFNATTVFYLSCKISESLICTIEKFLAVTVQRASDCIRYYRFKVFSSMVKPKEHLLKTVVL